MAKKTRRTGMRGLNPGRRFGVGALLVEPYLQVKLGLFILLLNLFFAAVIGGVFLFYVMDVYSALSVYFKLDEAESLLTWSKFSWPLIVGGSLVFLFVLLTFLVTIRYTHKIYGPLVSIHNFLDLALSGQKPEPLKLRASDQLNDLAEKINQLYKKTND